MGILSGSTCILNAALFRLHPICSVPRFNAALPAEVGFVEPCIEKAGKRMEAMFALSISVSSPSDTRNSETSRFCSSACKRGSGTYSSADAADDASVGREGGRRLTGMREISDDNETVEDGLGLVEEEREVLVGGRRDDDAKEEVLF